MKKFVLFALPLLFAMVLKAQRPMVAEDLFRFQRIGGQVVSPNGEYAVFIVTRYDVEANKGIRRAEMIHLRTGKQETLIPEEYSPSELAFRPDGKKLGFISSKDGSSQLWECDMATRQFGNVTGIEGGIHLFQYSPDASQLLIGRRVKMDKEAKEKYPQLPKTNARIIDGLMYRHWNEWSDYSYNHLFLLPYGQDDVSGSMLDIMEGEKFHSPTMPFGGAEEVSFSPDGKKVYYTCKKLYGTQSAISTNTDIYAYDIATKKTENISAPNQGYDKAPAFNKDGSKMAWLSMETAGYEADKNRILVMDMKKGKAVDITKDFFYSAESFVWSATGNEIYFLATKDATEQVFVYNFKDNSIKQLTAGVHNFTS
ncbi:MAG: peptidase S9, partial [Bacteroidota bacterium]|nr:peptidase S9 [Bacteroidota bacterium]MDX5431902.1 peptidase S9 [Bacteroidota bacterium]MDX5470616.1 peptidase S9 [Bacteroidota bacterium]